MPRSLYKKLYSGMNYSFLLESGPGPEKTSRFSFTGGRPFKVIKSRKDEIEIIERDGTVTRRQGNPILELEKTIDFKAWSGPGLLPHFWGGCVGFLGYDAAHFIEDLPDTTADDIELPDMVFFFPMEMVVMDHISGITRAVVLVEGEGMDPSSNSYQFGLERLGEFVGRIQDACGANISNKSAKSKWTAKRLGCNQTRWEFEESVRKVKDYIREGDVYQANISRRMEMEFDGDPFGLYERLFEINPSPFSAFMRLDGFSLVCCSPERLVKVDGQNISTRPIAGTRPRGSDAVKDLRLSEELILNEKERAEHLMLVDLERNDLGRVCRPGTVEVDELMVLESYSHVWHIVSNIKGMLREGVGLAGILSACFPGGTITGCPKVRCMEIIDEIEPTRRGPYTGSLGYIGFDGRMDLNIIIRTIVVKGDRAYIQTGAGIVADSVPEMEFQETEKKAEAMLEALSQQIRE
ncbi:MAG: anthranilate synthase component I family protein [Nitrospinae bacterium]|nr:anthranilate synthase component I family protein [Nitrospinota bacterium]